MSTLKTTLTGYATYRGREGHWSFLLHRITGLGTMLFLTIHILDIAFVYFAPSLFMSAVKVYQTTLFGIGEILLVYCVIYHGLNGLRVAYFDVYKPNLWEPEAQRKSTLIALVASIVIWLPAAAWMLRNLLINNFGMFGG